MPSPTAPIFGKIKWDGTGPDPSHLSSKNFTSRLDKASSTYLVKLDSSLANSPKATIAAVPYKAQNPGKATVTVAQDDNIISFWVSDLDGNLLQNTSILFYGVAPVAS